MRQSFFFENCAALLFTSLLFASAVQGASIHLQALQQRDALPLRRAACEPATPDVNEYRIIEDACNQNPQNDFNVCYHQIVAYVQQSTTATCSVYSNRYMGCLNGNNQNEAACSDQALGYSQCSNYTLQAYAYCGCYYNLPDRLYDCANVELQIRPAAPASSTASSGAPASSGIMTAPVPVGPGQNPLPILSIGPGAAISTPLSSSATTTSIKSVSCGPQGGVGCVTPSQTSSSSPFVASSSPLSSTSTTTSPSMEPTTLSSPPQPTPATISQPISIATPITGGSGQVTSTSLSTTIVTRTSTMYSCAATATGCPSSFPATSTYTESQTRTVLSCEGGCTGAAPVGAKDVCVRRKTVALRNVLGQGS